MEEGEYKKNCYFCDYLDSDDAGDDFCSGSYPICRKGYPKTYLKSFPFKKEQSCHKPNFWALLEVDSEMDAAFKTDDWDANIDRWKSWAIFKKKYEEAV